MHRRSWKSIINCTCQPCQQVIMNAQRNTRPDHLAIPELQVCESIVSIQTLLHLSKVNWIGSNNITGDLDFRARQS
jgi:hypothetical protein